MSQFDIDRNAPCQAVHEIEIDAPIDIVRGVLLDIDSWPKWNSKVSRAKLQRDANSAPGPLKPQVGDVFKWKSGVGIRSTFAVITRHRVGWTGVAFGTKAAHLWIFERVSSRRTRVVTEESFGGWLVSCMPKAMQKSLDENLTLQLTALKAEAEKSVVDYSDEYTG